MFNVRWLKENDYETLVKWWKDYDWNPIDKSVLPNNGLSGLMITKDEIDICAGFLYTSNSKMAMVEFIISNKDYKKRDKILALDLLINELTEIAKRNGYKVVLTNLINKGLKKLFLKNGYEKGDENILQLIKTF